MKIKITQRGEVTYREVVTYVDIAANCCVVRAQGMAETDPKEQWRWMQIDLLSTHERWRMSWCERLSYAWHTIRYGTASREWIEFFRPEEADTFIEAVKTAREAAFGEDRHD